MTNLSQHLQSQNISKTENGNEITLSYDTDGLRVLATVAQMFQGATALTWEFVGGGMVNETGGWATLRAVS